MKLLSPVAAAEHQPVALVEPFQVLDERGELTPAGRDLDIDLDLAKDLHTDMVLARRLDNEALALQRQGELHLWLMSWGQEAAQIGSIRATRPTDMVFPSYRDHAAGLSRGISPAEIFRQWRGHAHSGWDGEKYKFHIYSLVLGTQTLHATGYAVGLRLEGSDDVVLTYFGDGAASQGDVNEAFNWAAVGSAPIVFFCQNNQWAISTPTTAQMRAPLHVRAAGFGLQSYHVDGNDALAVHAVTRQAIEDVRAGGRPAFIEARTYRMGGHSSSDDPKRYREDDELLFWQAKDPISRLTTYLRNAGVAETYFDQLSAREEEFAADVRDQCKALTGEGLEAVFDQTYAEPHPALDEQRAAFVARTPRSVAE